jgi:hypothetical protein
MSLFGKKPESPASFVQPGGVDDALASSNRSYGIGDLIRLLKTIPIDQHPDLVVRVVKTTLESVGVQSSHVVDDAVRHETLVNERIKVLDGEIEGLTREIQARRDQIAQLQVDLSETTYAKERLLSVEGVELASSSNDGTFHAAKRTLPPPMPPPLHKSGKPPEPTTSS